MSFLWNLIKHAVPRVKLDLVGNVLGLLGPDGALLPAFGKTYTWANRPAASTVPGAIIFVSDVAGGAYFRSDGTRWKPISAVLSLGQQHTQVAAPGDGNENTLYSLSLPAGLMGPNDTIRASIIGTHTNSSNNKTWRMRIGSTSYMSSTVTTTATIYAERSVSNRNSVSSQISASLGQTGNGTASGAVVTSTIDMAQAQTFLITGQKATAGESMILESVLVELIRGAS